MLQEVFPLEVNGDDYQGRIPDIMFLHNDLTGTTYACLCLLNIHTICGKQSNMFDFLVLFTGFMASVLAIPIGGRSNAV